MAFQERRTEEAETWEPAGTRRLLFWSSGPPGRAQLGFLSPLGGLLKSSLQMVREGVAFLRVPQTPSFPLSNHSTPNWYLPFGLLFTHKLKIWEPSSSPAYSKPPCYPVTAE